MPEPFAWKPCHALERNRLPQAVRQWLLDRGSLTERLKQASDGDFAVQLLAQRWQRPTHDEAALLGLRPREQALVREVLLLCHGQPWVYARSVLPHATLSGPLRFLRRLQNQALGGLLFRDPSLQRSHFMLTTVQLPHAAIPLAIDTPCTVYGRRSLFRLQDRPLLVAEFFLPACRL